MSEFWDDRAFRNALRQYFDYKKNIDPVAELRRRAKNVGMRLVAIYKKNGVDLKAIDQKIEQLGERVKIRPKILAKGRAKGLTRRAMIMAEKRARKSAKGFTATGWFPAVQRLGGNPKDKAIRTGPKRGRLVEERGKSETLINEQPGAGYMQMKNRSAQQEALDKEVADMVKYIARKQDEAARRAGLT